MRDGGGGSASSGADATQSFLRLAASLDDLPMDGALLKLEPPLYCDMTESTDGRRPPSPPFPPADIERNSLLLPSAATSAAMRARSLSCCRVASSCAAHAAAIPAGAVEFRWLYGREREVEEVEAVMEREGVLWIELESEWREDWNEGRLLSCGVVNGENGVNDGSAHCSEI